MSKTAKTSNPSASSINRETYLKHLLTQASAAADESFLGLKPLRERAIALVGEQAFPARRDEEWRFTDLSDMLAQPFQRARAVKDANAELTSAELSDHLALFSEGQCLTTLNGQFVPELSAPINQDDTNDTAEGIIIAPLSQLVKRADFSDRIKPLLTAKLAQTKGNGEVFTALNTAGFSDALVIWITADQIFDKPICLVRAASGREVSHLRTLVVAEHHASLTLVESFWSPPSQAAADSDNPGRFNNSVTEIWLGEGAQVNHIRLQDESAETFHISKTAVDQSANSRYQCTAIELGAKLSRHNLEVYQSGPQTDTHMYGMSALRDRQLSDTHSCLTLTYPHSTATQIQKNIVGDRAHSVFNGKVYVSQEAQLTDASQLNRNLMLSSKARVDTKPELDIVADNVKCAHGATVSQLQADEVFYLQSRGIAAEQAQRLLLYGFAMEIVEKISVSALKQSLSDRLTQWAR